MEGLKPAMILDIGNATKCDFDDMLRAFIYNCLSDENKCAISEIEFRMEEVEDQRILVLDRGGEGKTDLNEKEEEAMLGTMFSDLLSERESKMYVYLQECIKAVLPMSNGSYMKGQLLKYVKLLNQTKTKRYGPYVDLCSNALASLEEINQKELGCLRPASDLNIRFRCLDPAAFRSQTGAKPSVGCGQKAKMDCLDALTETLEGPSLYPMFVHFQEFKRTTNVNLQVAAATINQISFTSTERARPIGHDVADVIEDAQQNDEATDVRSTASISNQSSHKSGSGGATIALGPQFKFASKKRLTPDGDVDTIVERESKRPCTMSSEESFDQSSESGRVQCTAHTSEMLAFNIGLHRVISVLHIDDKIFILYYDRQGTVCTSGINIWKDFPRFLVLLLLFQRFTLRDWGVVDTLDEHRDWHKAALFTDNLESINLSLNDNGLTKKYLAPEFKELEEIKIHTNEYLSSKPCRISGRVTRVFSCTGVVKGYSQKFVIKISHPELQRRHEGETLIGVRNIARELGEEMLAHLQELVFYADVVNTRTRRIRSLLNVDTKGHRVMRIVVTKRLEKLTTLDGAPLLTAWLDAVTCHSFLWKHGVEHGDISLSNIMCHPVTKRGVLGDFDLATIQWEKRALGSDRTGTVPFMAIDLLTKKYWDGKMRRHYHHELESFIWVLPFISLMKTNNGQAHESILAWTKLGYELVGCVKRAFFEEDNLFELRQCVRPEFLDCYDLAILLCSVLRRERYTEAAKPYKKEETLQQLVQKAKKSKRMNVTLSELMSPARDPHTISEHLSDGLLGGLFDYHKYHRGGFDPTFELSRRLASHRPQFEDLSSETEERAKNVFRPPPSYL